jgi:CRISPR-associated protein Csy3
MAKNSDGTGAELKTASVLAFERKIDPSDAVFSSGSWNDIDNETAWAPISNREKSVRGTISNRLKAKDANDSARLDAKIESPNLQRVDVASLPPDADTLKATFTLRILGGTGQPNACNEPGYQQKLLETVAGYATTTNYAELAKRYAINLANGRFLWRNRISAESVTVIIKHLKAGAVAKQWRFDAFTFSLKNFDVPGANATAVDELASVIQSALQGKGYELLQIDAFARLGGGQEAYPSQELILDKAKGDKSKVLYDVNGVAGMHSQKIGNALRTIDTWYPDEGGVGPIAVEPYGSVTSLGKAFRQPKQGQDFYSLLDGWVLKEKVPTLEQQHYVMATIIRGGVFGESGKD